MKEVLREDLKVGKLYYIECYTNNQDDNLVPNKNISLQIGIFKGLQLVTPQHIESWNEAVFDWFSISNMKNIKNVSDIYSLHKNEVHLNYYWKFYELQKFKIQSDMELRSVSKILQKIIGDEHVQWL
jgi:hypothetical protein